LRLDLLDELVLVGLGALGGLLALESEVRLELLGVPGVVGLDNVGVPVVLDERLEIFPVGGSWVWDVVV